MNDSELTKLLAQTKTQNPRHMAGVLLFSTHLLTQAHSNINNHKKPI